MSAFGGALFRSEIGEHAIFPLSTMLARPGSANKAKLMTFCNYHGKLFVSVPKAGRS